MKIWQFAGYHNSGKTTFLTALNEQLKESGIATAVMKHHAHKDDNENAIFKKGTDTGRLWESSPDALTYITPEQSFHRSLIPVDLSEWVMFYQMLNRFDVLLIEGFKKAGYMKVLFHRSEDDDHLLSSLENIQCVITADSVERLQRLTVIPVFSRQDSQQVIDDLINQIGGNRRDRKGI